MKRTAGKAKRAVTYPGVVRGTDIVGEQGRCLETCRVHYKPGGGWVGHAMGCQYYGTDRLGDASLPAKRAKFQRWGTDESLVLFDGAGTVLLDVCVDGPHDYADCCRVAKRIAALLNRACVVLPASAATRAPKKARGT